MSYCAGCGTEFESRRRGGKGGPTFTRFCSKKCFGRTVTYKGGPRASRHRRRYGMEPGEFQQRLTEQDNSCALCRVPFDDEHKIYVDHDHETRANRSLLCPRCNQIVGVFDQLEWKDILLYFGYTRFHGAGIELATLMGGEGKFFPETNGKVDPDV